jgi:hypothetical protein
MEEGRMVMRRARGSTMAFYAMFILMVGVPLMALTLDIGRVRRATVKLGNATEAACAAYANMMDVAAWQNGVHQFAPGAEAHARSFFYWSAPPNAGIGFTPIIVEGHPMQVQCRASAFVVPFIDLGLGNYSVSVTADAKADWISGPFGINP